MKNMSRDLKDLINDTKPIPDDDHDIEGDVQFRIPPKSQCVFWREIMKEVKAKGSKAVSGIQNQFASFEKTQPG